MSLYPESIVATVTGIPKLRIAGARKFRLREGTDWELAGGEVCYFEGGLVKLMLHCQVGSSPAKKRAMDLGEQAAAVATVIDVASRAPSAPRLVPEYSPLRALSLFCLPDHLRGVAGPVAANGHGVASEWDGGRNNSGATGNAPATGTLSSAAGGESPAATAEPPDEAGTDSITGEMMERAEDEPVRQAQGGPPSGAAGPGAVAASLERGKIAAAPPQGLPGPQSGAAANPSLGDQVVAAAGREMANLQRRLGTLRVVKISPNARVLHAAEPGGAIVLVRVKDNRNFTAGMALEAWAPAPGMTPVWVHRGNCPRTRGRY